MKIVVAGKIKKTGNRYEYETRVAAPAFGLELSDSGVAVNFKQARDAVLYFLERGIGRAGEGIEQNLSARRKGLDDSRGRE